MQFLRMKLKLMMKKITKVLNEMAYIAYEDMAIERYKTFSDEYKSTVKFEEFLEDCGYIMEAYEI